MDRRFRLRKSREFELARSAGRSWAHPLLVLYARRNQLTVSRAGFSASKRVGKAVTRNRIKRVMREAVRQRLPEIAPGWDLLFIARAPIAKADFAAVSAAVEQLLRRSDLWSGPPAHDRASRRASVAQDDAGSSPAGGKAEGIA